MLSLVVVWDLRKDLVHAVLTHFRARLYFRIKGHNCADTPAQGYIRPHWTLSYTVLSHTVLREGLKRKFAQRLIPRSVSPEVPLMKI